MAASIATTARSQPPTDALHRARNFIKQQINEGKIPKPSSCDGCGVPGGAGKGQIQLRRFVYEPLDPAIEMAMLAQIEGGSVEDVIRAALDQARRSDA